MLNRVRLPELARGLGVGKLGFKGLAAVALIGLGTATTVRLAAQPVPPPPPAAAAQATLSGSVAEVFGTHVVLQGPAGRALVDLGPRPGEAELRVGEAVTVTGRAGPGPFRAESLRRGDGPEVAIRRPPPPGGPGGPGGPREEARITPDQAVAAVRAAGYAPTGTPTRGPRHFDVPATNPRGEAVRLHVDLDGRLYKEVWARPASAARPTSAPSEADARRLASEAGFTPTGGFSAKPRHAELDVTDRDGRRVRLHVEADGVREVNFPR